MALPLPPPNELRLPLPPATLRHPQNETELNFNITAEPTTASEAESASDSEDVPPANSTLYPKISGKLPDLTHHIAKYANKHSPDLLTRPIPFTGTVKLHGTHAEILVHPGGEIVCQSRNRTVITLESDNLGFAAFCSTRGEAIQKLAKDVRKWWRERHPSRQMGEEPVLLAGEWIGKGVQRGVAIAELEKRFVLCGLHVEGVWEPIEEYVDLEVPEAGLLNVSRGGFYHLAYVYADEGAAFLEKAKDLTLAVAASCPFGKAMGVEGEGEGIVWNPAVDSGLPNTADFWLKTKGEQFVLHQRIPVDKSAKQVSMIERGKVFAIAQCSESRLAQAWAYLLEMGIERSMKGAGSFLGWLTKDIEVEERREIAQEKLGKAWKSEVTKIAKAWYEKKIAEGG